MHKRGIMSPVSYQSETKCPFEHVACNDRDPSIFAIKQTDIKSCPGQDLHQHIRCNADITIRAGLPLPPALITESSEEPLLGS